MTVLSMLGEAAIEYARRGWRVFPCILHGKAPLTDHGLKVASRDEGTVRQWWTNYDEANIGHPTGEHIVLDVDGPEGEKALAALEEQYGQLPVTLTARTGRGRHLYFAKNSTRLRNSAGKLGAHLDIRGEGGYVIVPPSIHWNGKQYEWLNPHVEIAPLPAWIMAALGEPEQSRVAESEADGKITEGKRNTYLTSLAGAMRRKGMGAAAIEAALLKENQERCEPPLSKSEVGTIAGSVARYEPAKKESLSPWAIAESVDEFLESGEDGADFLDPEKRILARAAVTEIFSPRGLGKSLFALWLAIQLGRRGLHVMYIDRDNPRHVIRERLRGFGATGQIADLKIISREKCPPLTDAGKWAQFPFQDYDAVILDSFDSAAEGVGEQDSSKPSRAIAPILDIARRENGPAVLILGNTIKSAAHSRGSGVIEDRADIVYEVRDATGFHASGQQPWFEELPVIGAGGWASRASRRNRQEKFRLAFVASKFRVGQEPEPFVLEIDLTVEPWTVKDVTNEIDSEGAEVREHKAAERTARLDSAAEKLKQEIERRAESGNSPLRKRQDAEPFLMALGLKRSEARNLLADRDGTDWVLKPSSQDKRIIHVLPLRENEGEGHVSTSTEDAETKANTGTNCGGSISMPPATSEPCDSSQICGSAKPENVAENCADNTLNLARAWR